MLNLRIWQLQLPSLCVSGFPDTYIKIILLFNKLIENLVYTVFQTIGSAFLLSAAQSAFVNKIATVLRSSTPDVDVATVIATGATEIRNVFPADQVPGIVIAYMEGLRVTFAIAATAVGLAFVVSFFSSWKRLKLNAAGGAA